ncbi:MAG: hypothetical protein U0103_17820 [Candidatus Obscuribacterales bacterium]
MSLEPTKSIEELMQEAHGLVAGGQFKEAEQVLFDVIKRGDKKSNLQCYDALSLIAQERGDVEESIRFALSTIAANKELYGEESDQVVSSMVRLANIYEQVGKDEEANDLHFRAKMISDKLVFGAPEADSEPEVGSAEQAEQFRSTLKYYAKPSTDEEQPSSPGAKSASELEKDPDDMDFVFAEDEPRETKSGWLMDAIRKANEKKDQDSTTQSTQSKTRDKGETTGPHKFRDEDAKEEPHHRSRSQKDGQEQRESRTNASVVRKELLNTDSRLSALAHGKEEIARSLDLSNIGWSLREFVKKRSNIVAVGIGATVFFVVLLVAAYLQPRKVTPLDAYVAMPHVYKTMSGGTRVNLVRQDAAQVQQGDTSMTVPVSFVVDWRSHLEVLVRSFFEKQYWLRKAAKSNPEADEIATNDSLVADDGTVFYTQHNPELLLGDQMQSQMASANAYYLDHSHYPSEAGLSAYQNIFTRSASKPKLKRAEFIATDADDVLRQIDRWRSDLSNSREVLKPGVLDCYELLVSYPKGKVELFGVRSAKLDLKPQLVVSTNGELSENKGAQFIPEGAQFRPRRLWIEAEHGNDVDSFILHHASLVFCLLVSTVVASSYVFLNLHGTARRIRFNVLFASLLMLAVYAAGTAFTF